jgi:hypothetical protein
MRGGVQGALAAAGRMREREQRRNRGLVQLKTEAGDAASGGGEEDVFNIWQNAGGKTDSDDSGSESEDGDFDEDDDQLIGEWRERQRAALVGAGVKKKEMTREEAALSMKKDAKGLCAKLEKCWRIKADDRGLRKGPMIGNGKKVGGFQACIRCGLPMQEYRCMAAVVGFVACVMTLGGLTALLVEPHWLGWLLSKQIMVVVTSILPALEWFGTGGEIRPIVQPGRYLRACLPHTLLWYYPRGLPSVFFMCCIYLSLALHGGLITFYHQMAFIHSYPR